MSVRRKATNSTATSEQSEQRDFNTVAANYGNGPVMRTVALELKPEVDAALSNFSTACSMSDGNAKYRQIGKLRAAAAASERKQTNAEAESNDVEEMSTAMRMATGVSQERATKPTVTFSFNNIKESSQAGRLMKGMGADIDSYRVMVESAGHGADPVLHFYPAHEDSVNPLLSGNEYTDLQHDSFVALVKTYNLNSFEKLADHIDGVDA